MARTALKERLTQGPLILDGGMGSQLIARGAQPSQGNDYLNIEAPEIIQAVHADYIAAGSQAILTNTFGANAISLKRHNLADQTEAICTAGAQLARQAAGEDRYVIGDIGPCGDFLEPLGLLRPQELQEAFAAQARGLLGGGVDGFIIETMTALEEIEVGVQAVRSVIPDAVIFTSMAYDRNPTGFRTMMGVSPEDAVKRLLDLGVDAIGYNCGSATLEEYLELTQGLASAISGHQGVALLAEPNAGKPVIEDGQAVYKVAPDEFAQAIQQIKACGANLLGGCCGTTPAFIQAIASALGH